MPATYDRIQTTTLGTATSTVTFSSIPATYTDLVIVFNAAGSSYVNSIMRLNGDTGTNYSAVRLYGNGAAATTARYTTETYTYVGDLTTTINTTVIQIQNYANTSTFKTYISRNSAAPNGVDAFAGMWRKTPIAAITSVDIVAVSAATFTVGSTFTMYGIKAA
jgi:peptide methionine sulfoxide reductase MsrA